MSKPRREVVQQALAFLARREHSQKELHGKLRACGYEVKEVEVALTWMHAQNQQSDQRFAEACAASLIQRGYGSRRVDGELRERGVSADVASAWVAEAQAGDLDRADRILRRKQQNRPMTQMQMLRFLNSRGYPAEVARKATATILREFKEA